MDGLILRDRLQTVVSPADVDVDALQVTFMASCFGFADPEH